MRTGQSAYLELAKRWARATATLFAVGAVSGTVLFFELGLLWPKFMAHAGAIIGMPFLLEGFAFFAEANLLGLYLYGRNLISPLADLISGLVVVSGFISGIFVVTANAWMNSPTGFKLGDGHITDIDPIAATGFLVAALHGLSVLRDRGNVFYRSTLSITLGLACVSIQLQIVSGDLSARAVSRLQPVKLAAMESQIGGIPNDDTMEVDCAIPIPRGLSFLTAHDFCAKVVGLEEVPRDQWPSVSIVHWSFEIMIAQAPPSWQCQRGQTCSGGNIAAAGFQMTVARARNCRASRFCCD